MSSQQHKKEVQVNNVPQKGIMTLPFEEEKEEQNRGTSDEHGVMLEYKNDARFPKTDEISQRTDLQNSDLIAKKTVAFRMD